MQVLATDALKVNHVTCSNLTHYSFLVKVLMSQKDVVHLDCAFQNEERENPLRVDIVCNNGMKWIKAVARNTKSLIEAAQGGASYGAKSIVDQAREYVECAKENPYMFQEPKVTFYFSNRLDEDFHNEILATGVELKILDDNYNVTEQCSSSEDILDNITTLNLDITTMLAYISSLTNGSCRWAFREPILTEQAEKETVVPLKPILDDVFKNRTLICCEAAYKSFQDIVNLLGGPNEKRRAKELTARLEICEDVSEIPAELSALSFCGKIKERSLKIFAFGVVRKAVTVTSNEGFIRSAKMQVCISFWKHTKKNDNHLIFRELMFQFTSIKRERSQKPKKKLPRN